MDVYGLSHTGTVRDNNQDCFVVRRLPFGAVLLAVMDGMGGEAGGGFASKIAAEAFEDVELTSVSTNHLADVVLTANRAILDETERNPDLEGMGTTITAAVAWDKKAYWVNVGDSRLYLYRNGKLNQVTKDHRFVQTFLDHGEMSQDEVKTHPLRRMLDQCVGCPYCAPDTGSFDLQDGDVLLLCTDGLHNAVFPDDLAAALSLETTTKGKAERLLQMALDGGGRDNITIIVIVQRQYTRA